MVKNYIDYAELIDRAMQYVVKMALEDVSKYGLPGEHHFFITFKTRAEGVMISEELLKKYPEEMTIVLQHQYHDLEVNEDSFSVVLSFDHIKHNLTVPYATLVSFVDPSVKFGLQFSLQGIEKDDEKPNETAKKPKKLTKDKVEKLAEKENKGKNNVVALDSFRGKKGGKKD